MPPLLTWGWMAAARGDRRAARGYDAILAAPAPGLPVFDQAIRLHHRGVIAAALGDRTRALDLLRQALALGVPLPMDSVHVHPAYRTLRGWGSFDNVTRVSDRL